MPEDQSRRSLPGVGSADIKRAGTTVSLVLELPDEVEAMLVYDQALIGLQRRHLDLDLRGSDDDARPRAIALLELGVNQHIEIMGTRAALDLLASMFPARH